MRRASLLIAVAALVLTISGCSARVASDSPPIDKEEAVAIALKLSPIKNVDSVELTPPGPVMWVVYGRDADGQPLAVWVRLKDALEGTADLKGKVTAAEAVAAVKAQGGPVWDEFKPVLVHAARPSWYVFLKTDGNRQGYALVDLSTGKVTTHLPTP